MVVRGTIISMMMVRMAQPEKKKLRWGLDKRREIPEKFCLMRYRISLGEVRWDEDEDLFSSLVDAYNTNTIPAPPNIWDTNMAYSPTQILPFRPILLASTLPLQAPSTSVLCATRASAPAFNVVL